MPFRTSNNTNNNNNNNKEDNVSVTSSTKLTTPLLLLAVQSGSDDDDNYKYNDNNNSSSTVNNDDDDDVSSILEDVILYDNNNNNNNNNGFVDVTATSLLLDNTSIRSKSYDNDDDDDDIIIIIKETIEEESTQPPSIQIQIWKLLFGAIGVWGAYLYHGNLEEDLFRYKNNDDNSTFTYIWLLQVFESTAACIVGLTGKQLFANNNNNNNTNIEQQQPKVSTTTKTKKSSKSYNNNNNNSFYTKITPFLLPGASQLFAKACTGLALAAGVSFPVVVLAKSAKIVPVMLGQLALGGSTYKLRDYIFVMFLVGGTIMLSSGGEKVTITTITATSTMSTTYNNNNNNNNEYFIIPDSDDDDGINNIAYNDITVVGRGIMDNNIEENSAAFNDSHHNTSNHGNSSTPVGIICITLSLVLDGITAGLQKRLKQQTASNPPTAYEFLTYTNISMVTIALFISIMSGEIEKGQQFLKHNPAVLTMLLHCCFCSAVGQSFVFYLITAFDPLVLSTVTTTRKILSVLLSIMYKGHPLTQRGIAGLSLALTGLLIEIYAKLYESRPKITNPISSNGTTKRR